ncbi:hypothetical protein V6N13_120543 [Hibiscus sabdariffa]|uniref:Secreted protein n=1 Tax=Hibiscus sabdariffa TaxID=183260 RepID=A0ABR2E4K7_9ROSI
MSLATKTVLCFSFCLASERRSYLNWDWERSWDPIKKRELGVMMGENRMLRACQLSSAPHSSSGGPRASSEEDISIQNSASVVLHFMMW